MNSYLTIEPHKTLKDKVYHALKLAILEGNIKPGKNINLKSIATQLQVSITPVREALQKLVTEGLVENIPYQGMVVIPISVEDFKEIIPVCGALEALSSQILAKRQDNQKEILELEKIINKMIISVDIKDELNYNNLDNQFHYYIMIQSQNYQLIKIYDSLQGFIKRFRLISRDINERFIQSLEEHQLILKSIRESNPASAGILCQIHNENMAKNILKSINES